MGRPGGGRAASPGGWGEGPGPPSALAGKISAMFGLVEERSLRGLGWQILCGLWRGC